MDLSPYFGTLAAFAGTVALLTSFAVAKASNWIDTTKVILFGFVKVRQVISWVIGVGLAVLLHFFGSYVGSTLFADYTVVATVAYGFGVTLAVNGVFDIAKVEEILKRIFVPKDNA